MAVVLSCSVMAMAAVLVAVFLLLAIASCILVVLLLVQVLSSVYHESPISMEPAIHKYMSTMLHSCTFSMAGRLVAAGNRCFGGSGNGGGGGGAGGSLGFRWCQCCC